MRALVARSLLAICCGMVFVGLAAPTAAPTQAPETEPWVMPRTPDGHPDLQGNWTNATITPIQRRQGQGPVLTAEQVAEIEGGGGRAGSIQQPSPATRIARHRRWEVMVRREPQAG